MSLQFCNLGKGDARGVQQTFANRDIRQYGNLSMYIHAENNVKRRSRKKSTMTASEAKQHKEELEKLQHKVRLLPFVVFQYISVV
jgi:hypothetical protein